MEKAKEMLISSGKMALNVTPKARKEGIAGLNAANELVVKVRVAPEHGKANEAVIALIADTFDIPQSCLSITRGHASRHKTIAICRA